MKTSPPHHEELDLTIPEMDSPMAEKAVKAALESLPGLLSLRLIERGAFARYDAGTITKDQICAAVRQAGYRASVFQDSKTGETGKALQ